MDLYKFSIKNEFDIVYSPIIIKNNNDTYLSKFFLLKRLLKALYVNKNDKLIDLQIDEFYFSTGIYGKPYLLLGNKKEIPVSFSRCNELLWGATSIDVKSIGIDSATSLEFNDNYPFSKVFHAKEIEAVSTFVDDEYEAAALLWSLKEAFVKMLGCGFHLINPIDIFAIPLTTSITSCIPFKLYMTEKNHNLQLNLNYNGIESYAVRHEKVWVSLAFIYEGIAI